MRCGSGERLHETLRVQPRPQGVRAVLADALRRRPPPGSTSRRSDRGVDRGPGHRAVLPRRHGRAQRDRRLRPQRLEIVAGRFRGSSTRRTSPTRADPKAASRPFNELMNRSPAKRSAGAGPFLTPSATPAAALPSIEGDDAVPSRPAARPPGRQGPSRAGSADPSRGSVRRNGRSSRRHRPH